MFNAIIRAGGLILGAPIAAAGHVLDAVGVLNFTGWQRQMKEFGAEMINGADYIARLREEREQLLESIAAIQAADPLAVTVASAELVAIKAQLQKNEAAAAAAAAAANPTIVP